MNNLEEMWCLYMILESFGLDNCSVIGEIVGNPLGWKNISTSTFQHASIHTHLSQENKRLHLHMLQYKHSRD